MTWYYLHNEQTVGPISESELEGLIHSGTLSPDVQVWREGMTEWQPYGVVKVPAAPAHPPGLRIARHEPASTAVSAEVLSGTTERVVEIAPMGQRIFAKLIDVAFIGGCIFVIVVFFHWIAGFIQKSGGPEKLDKSFVRSLLRIAASVIGLSSGWIMRNSREAGRHDPVKRSLGKRLMKIAVVDMAGRPLSRPARFSRFAVQLLMVGVTFFIVISPLLLMANRPPRPMPPPVYRPGQPPTFQRPPDRVGRFLLSFFIAVVLSQAGYAVALFNRDRRGLHDLVCNTRVIASP